MKKSNYSLLFALMMGLLSTLTPLAYAEVAVIVHPSISDELSKKYIARLFLGKEKKFPGGSAAIPLYQVPGTSARKSFDAVILKKSVSQIKGYWSRLVFTGKSVPPKEVDGDSEVLALIAKDPKFIGYVDAGSADSSVKVLLKF